MARPICLFNLPANGPTSFDEGSRVRKFCIPIRDNALALALRAGESGVDALGTARFCAAECPSSAHVGARPGCLFRVVGKRSGVVQSVFSNDRSFPAGAPWGRMRCQAPGATGCYIGNSPKPGRPKSRPFCLLQVAGKMDQRFRTRASFWAAWCSYSALGRFQS